MIEGRTATDFRMIARQSTFLKGFVLKILFPLIEKEASCGRYNTEILLSNFPQLAHETRKDLMELLKAKGFKAVIKDEYLKVDWS